MTETSSLGPRSTADRVVLIDALRGIALLGILFMNMTWFTGFAVLSGGQRLALGTAGIDAPVDWLIHFLVEGKFWSLYALLLGVGAAVLRDRAEARGDDFGGLFRRRMMVLLLIGLTHAVLVWFGDIVSLYAVVGLALPLFVRCSSRAVLCRAGVLLAAPIVQGVLWLMADRAIQAAPGPAAVPGYGPGQLLVFFGSGTYAEAFVANWAFLKERWFLAVYEGRFFKLLGTFLLGYWACRHGIFHEPARHRRLQ